MTEFPALENEQVAMIFAEASTGIVLDINFNYATTNEQQRYTICQSLEHAVAFADKIRSQKDNIEFIIYNSQKEVLKFITP